MLQDLREEELLSWLREQKLDFYHYYSSLDLRENYFKAVAVDINLFPSGFNNFSIEKLRPVFERTLPKVAKLGLLVENFTRNEKYLVNVTRLKEVIKSLGIEVYLFTILEGKVVPLDGMLLSSMEMVLLNNDLTESCPEELFALPSLPNPLFGWYKRRKSLHLNLYNQVVEEMAREISFDPWFLSSYLDTSSGINFRERIGLEVLAEKAEALLKKIRNKYADYNIKKSPHLFIKANNGTFGLGVIKITSPDEILKINKKTRHTIATIKGGQLNDEVVLQEGIETEYFFQNCPGERVLYQVQDQFLGTFVRFHEGKTVQDSLNAVGMQISSLEEVRKLDLIIGRIANLALAREYQFLLSQD